MSFQQLPPVNQTSMFGTVVNPVTSQSPDASAMPIGMGRNGSIFADEIHGQFYEVAKRGNLFVAQANAATGRTILAPGGTTSGFMFYNPVGSGINMEIVEILVEPLTATDVVASVGLEFGAPPTAVGTAAASSGLLIGGSNATALGKASYGSTIVAMTFLQWLPVFVQTTAGVLQGSLVNYRPNGSLVLAPGGAVNIVSNNSQSTNLWAQHVIWAEWLR